MIMSPTRLPTDLKMFKVIFRPSGAISEVKFRAPDGNEYDFFVAEAGIHTRATGPTMINFAVYAADVEIEYHSQ